MQTLHTPSVISCKASLLGLALLAALGLARPASAQFLVDPSTGTDITTGFSDTDDGAQTRALGGIYSIHGTNVSQISVQVNGFLSLQDGSGYFADRSITTLASAVGGPVIAPFYDDLLLTTGSSVRENIQAGSYYALTYTIGSVDSTNASQTDQFQEVLFTGDSTVGGTAFQAGDIVFSYGALNAPVADNNFTVGVARNGATGTGVFGSSQFSTTASFASLFSTSSQSLLFHRDPITGGYTSSVIPTHALAAAPEPSQTMALGLGILGLAGLTIQARKRPV